MLPTKFWFIWPCGFREDFQKQTNQKQESPVVAMFVNGIGTKWVLFIEDRPQMLPTKFQIIWPSGFRGEELLWWPCLLMDWDGMSNLYREPSIDASY